MSDLQRGSECHPGGARCTQRARERVSRGCARGARRRGPRFRRPGEPGLRRGSAAARPGARRRPGPAGRRPGRRDAPPCRPLGSGAGPPGDLDARPRAGLPWLRRRRAGRLGAGPPDGPSPAAAAGGRPCRAELFRIRRSTNANEIVYAAQLDEAGRLDEDDPLVAYWLMHAEDGHREG